MNFSVLYVTFAVLLAADASNFKLSFHDLADGQGATETITGPTSDTKKCYPLKNVKVIGKVTSITDHGNHQCGTASATFTAFANADCTHWVSISSCSMTLEGQSNDNKIKSMKYGDHEKDPGEAKWGSK